MRYLFYWAPLLGCAIAGVSPVNASTASATSARHVAAAPETGAATGIDRSAFAQLFVPEIPAHFGGFWGMTREVCRDKNAGVLMTVQGHAVTLADWSGPAWSLNIAEVAVAPGDPDNLLVDFKKPDSRSNSEDFAPILKFVDFVKLTLSENGQLLTVTQPSDQTFKSFHFHFCAALPSN